VNRESLAWSLVVSMLLVTVVGTVASGHLTGESSLSFGTSGATSVGPVNSTRTAGSSTVTETVYSNSTSYETAKGSSRYISPISAELHLSDWPLYVAMVVLLAVGLAFLARSTGRTRVYDFAAALEQLDRQRYAMAGSWSQKLRNVALLRYYSLMRSVCAQMGLQDSPSETPLEYLARLATALKISEEDAVSFATAFERARYGGELTDDEARKVATSMASFVDGLKGSINYG